LACYQGHIHAFPFDIHILTPNQHSHPECGRLVAGDPEYVKQQAEHRFVYADAANLSVDCGSIRARNHFAGRPLSEAEAQFPLAYARIVHEVGTGELECRSELKK
jgi:hypothetical protein